MMSTKEVNDLLGRTLCHLAWAKGASWESHLRLHIRPKPLWMPTAVWKWLINLLLMQTERRD